MKKIIMLLTVFLVPTICWLMGAFIANEINPMLWKETSRFMLVFFSTFVLLCIELFISEYF